MSEEDKYVVMLYEFKHDRLDWAFKHVSKTLKESELVNYILQCQSTEKHDYRMNLVKLKKEPK